MKIQIASPKNLSGIQFEITQLKENTINELEAAIIKKLKDIKPNISITSENLVALEYSTIDLFDEVYRIIEDPDFIKIQLLNNIARWQLTLKNINITKKPSFLEKRSRPCPKNAPEITINVKTITSGIIGLFKLRATNTIFDLKQKISEKTGANINQQRLTYRGQELNNNNNTLASYGITSDCVVCLVSRLQKKKNPTTDSFVKKTPYSSTVKIDGPDCLNATEYVDNYGRTHRQTKKTTLPASTSLPTKFDWLNETQVGYFLNGYVHFLSSILKNPIENLQLLAKTYDTNKIPTFFAKPSTPCKIDITGHIENAIKDYKKAKNQKQKKIKLAIPITLPPKSGKINTKGFHYIGLILEFSDFTDAKFKNCSIRVYDSSFNLYKWDYTKNLPLYPNNFLNNIVKWIKNYILNQPVFMKSHSPQYADGKSCGDFVAFYLAYIALMNIVPNCIAHLRKYHMQGLIYVPSQNEINNATKV